MLLLTITQTDVVLPINRLKRIDPGFIESRHPAVGKQVIVMAKMNTWRGQEGTVLSHNTVLNTFQVAFPNHVGNFNAPDLWLE